MTRSSRPKPIRVLIAEDNPSVLALIEESVSTPEIDVTLAHDAESTWQAFCDVKPEIVLLDLIMPGANGMDLLDQIIKRNPATYVVLLTGQNRVDYAVQAVNKGAYDYLTKPFEIADLQRRIGSIVDDIRQQRPCSSANSSAPPAGSPVTYMIAKVPQCSRYSAVSASLLHISGPL